MTIKDLAEKMVEKVMCLKKSEIIYSKNRPGEVRRFISNSDKMKSLGWTPKVNIDEGLDKYVNWRKEIDDLDFYRNIMIGM